MTVEIGFALLTGVFVAALAFGAVLSPLLFTDPGHAPPGGLAARYAGRPTPATPAAPAPTHRPARPVGPGPGRPAWSWCG
ncbi:DUF6332 family protein [Streptomyces rimosus]|uniref:DUF6332 family protein n=1 Tax=Streptomyces rimosus TaxID=1927 RepID=UPI00373AE668